MVIMSFTQTQLPRRTLSGSGVSPKISTAATIAILGAIGGVISTFAGHPFIALFIHAIALVCGIAGLVMAASSRVRGGMISVVAIGLCIVGLAIDVLVGIFKIITF